MLGLLKKDNKVWFSKSNNPKRKLKYTLEIIEVDKKFVGINTHLSNKIVMEALQEKKIKELIKYNNIKPEVKFSDKTRFDFLISNNKEKCFLEVINVTNETNINNNEKKTDNKNVAKYCSNDNGSYCGWKNRLSC